MHYTTDFFGPIGGGAVVVRGLANSLRRLGLEQSILTESKTAERKVDIVDGIEIIQLPVYRRISAYWIVRHLKEIFQDKKFDIIHFHGAGSFAADYCSILKAVGIISMPTVLTTHGMSGFKLAWRAINPRSPISLRERIIRGIPFLYFASLGSYELKSQDKIAYFGEDERTLLRKVGIHPSKMIKIPQAIDDIFFKSNEAPDRSARSYLLYVGRITPYKGLDTLVRGIHILQNKGIHMECVVIGSDAGYIGNLKKLCQDLGLNKIVHIREHTDRADLVSIYRNAILSILPSMSEGFPLTLVESMACSTPFIATPVGSIPELAQASGAGRMVPIGNAETLAEAILSLLNNSQLWKSMSTNGLIFSRKFRWDSIAKEYYAVYRELLASY